METVGLAILTFILGVFLMLVRNRILLTRIQAQTAQLESQYALTNAMIENAPAFVVGLDSGGRIIVFNSCAEQLTGYSREEVMGKLFFDLLVPPQVQQRHEDPQEFIASLFGNPPSPDTESPCLCKDGTERMIQWGGAQVAGPGGGVVKHVGIGQDVTAQRAAEEALRESEQRYRMLADNVTDVIWITDMNLRYTYISPSGTRGRGYSIEELMDQTLEEALTPASFRVAMQAFEEELALEQVPGSDPGRSRTVELEFTCKDGSTRWGELTTSFLRDADGVPTGLVGITRDITDRKRAEDELRQSEEKYRSLTEHLPDVVVQVSPEGVIQYLSSAITQLAGYEPEEGLGQSVVDFIAEADRPRIMETLDEASQTGETHTVEFTLIAKSGEEIPVEVSSSPLVEEGRLVAFQCVMRDITERKQAEAALKAERERLAVTLRSIGDGVIATDTEGRVVLINRVAESLTGWPSAEALGKPAAEVFDVIDPETRERVTNPVAQVLETGGIVRLASDAVLVSRDGVERVIRDSGAPIGDTQGEVIGVVLVFRDVTDRIAWEQRMREFQKMEAIGVLASGIAHDFNNVLQAIASWISLMQIAATLDEKLEEGLHQVMAACERGADLVQQLLAFSHPAEPSAEPMDVGKTVADVCGILARTLPKSVVIEYAVLSDELWWAESDAHQFEQALVNLGINASEAMAAGGQLTMGLENLEVDQEYAQSHLALGITPGRYVRLSVADSGAGMDEVTLSRIFEPFFTTKQRAEHSGLGLAMVYGIVRAHGGYIDVASTPGEGTTFEIYLPAVSPPVAVAAAQPARQPAARTDKARTVLLVDDEAVVVRSGCEFLEYFGYKVLTATSGEEAVELFQTHHQDIDLVILDLVMPRMDGEKCLEQLLAIDPEAVVIIASGYLTDQDKRERLEPKVKGFLDKPFTTARILGAVRSALGND